MAPNWTIRPVTDADYADIAATECLIRPEPVTEGQVREWVSLDRSDKEFPIEWLAIEESLPDGSSNFLGWGCWGKGHWLAPDERHIRVNVAPAKRRMGVGSHLLRYLESLVERDNPTAIYAWSRGYDRESLRWAKSRGYVVVRERPDAVLDLTKFDPSAFQAALDEAREMGIEVRVMWDDDVKPHMLGLYKVASDTFRDVPFRSAESSDVSYEDWVREYDESAAKKVFAVAFSGGEVVGYSDIWMPLVEGQSAILEYTAVLKGYRGKGIAFALKVASTAEAAKAGAKAIRTTNDPDNPAILRLNEKMGFVTQPGRVLLKKTLSITR